MRETENLKIKIKELTNSLQTAREQEKLWNVPLEQAVKEHKELFNEAEQDSKEPLAQRYESMKKRFEVLKVLCKDHQ